MVLHSLLDRKQLYGHFCVLRYWFSLLTLFTFYQFFWFSPIHVRSLRSTMHHCGHFMVFRFVLVYLGNWKINRNDSGKLNRCTEHKLICRMKCIPSFCLFVMCRSLGVCVYCVCAFSSSLLPFMIIVSCASEPPTETLATHQSLLFSLLSYTYAGTTRVTKQKHIFVVVVDNNARKAQIDYA